MKDITVFFPPCVGTVFIGVMAGCPILIIQTRDYGSLESYAATSAALLHTRGIQEVLKVGIAAFKEHEDAEHNREEVVSLGDIAIMDGSHTRPVLMVVNGDYGVTKR